MMHLQWEKKTKKNMETVFSTPKKCNRCREGLRNVTALMMGISWECDNCERKWHGNLARIV